MYHYYDYKSLFKIDEILVYLRKSRSDDPLLTVEEVLQKHETILDEWSEKNFGEAVPEKNKFREVESGETIADRPQMLNLLKRIENPQIKAVMVVEVQRLSRGDLEDAGRLIKLLRYTNTYVITPQKTYDLRDDYDRDMFERELKRGNEFLEYQKKIMSRGRLLSVSQGNFIASIPPYGYDKTWIHEGKKKCPTLKINEQQAEIVRLIFDLYVNKDMGFKRICNYLDDLKIKPPKGEYWSAPALKDMIANIHYIGKVKWNWRKTVTIVEDSEIIKTRPKSQIGEFLIYNGKHEAIISEELFNAAQEKKGRNHRAKPTTKVRNPLASLLWCHCGRAMSLKFYKGKNGKDTQSARLSCEGQTHCKTGSCIYDELMDKILEILQRCIDDFEIRLQNDTGDSVKLHNQLIKNLEKKMKELESREISQWKSQSHPDPSQRMPADIFKKLNEELLKEKDEVKQALCKVYDSVPEQIDYEEKLKRFTDALTALKNPSVSAEEKNKLLKACIERIVYKRETPKRLTRNPGEKKGTRLSVGGSWTTPPIEIDVKLRV